MRSGTARITDAENTTLSLESRFDLAYNAAHAFSLAALRYRGFRDDAHRKRNLTEYEGAADLDAAIVAAVIRVARSVEARVRAFDPLP